MKWGCMRYLSIVNVLPTVDDRSASPQFRREQTGVTNTKAKQCTAVDGAGSKTYFRHLKERPT